MTWLGFDWKASSCDSLLVCCINTVYILYGENTCATIVPLKSMHGYQSLISQTFSAPKSKQSASFIQKNSHNYCIYCASWESDELLPCTESLWKAPCQTPYWGCPTAVHLTAPPHNHQSCWSWKHVHKNNKSSLILQLLHTNYQDKVTMHVDGLHIFKRDC